jgi:hypothetical protein
MRERDTREEDKGEEMGLGGGVFCFGENWGMKEDEILKERRKLEEHFDFGEISKGHCCCWELWAWGPGNHKDS